MRVKGVYVRRYGIWKMNNWRSGNGRKKTGTWQAVEEEQEKYRRKRKRDDSYKIKN